MWEGSTVHGVMSVPPVSAETIVAALRVGSDRVTIRIYTIGDESFAATFPIGGFALAELIYLRNRFDTDCR